MRLRQRAAAPPAGAGALAAARPRSSALGVADGALARARPLGRRARGGRGRVHPPADRDELAAGARLRRLRAWSRCASCGGESAPIAGSWGFDLALVAVAAGARRPRLRRLHRRGLLRPLLRARRWSLLLAVLHDRLAKRWPQARDRLLRLPRCRRPRPRRLRPGRPLPATTAPPSTPRAGASSPRRRRHPRCRGRWTTSIATPRRANRSWRCPLDAGLHFMTDRPPALYDAMFLPGLLDSRADELAAIARLEAEGVRYAVIDQRASAATASNTSASNTTSSSPPGSTRGGAPVASFGDGDRASAAPTPPTSTPSTASAIEYRFGGLACPDRRDGLDHPDNSPPSRPLPASPRCAA